MTTIKPLIKMLSFILTAVLLVSCGTEPNNEEENQINPNIVKIIECCNSDADNYIPGTYHLGQLVSNRIFATGPISKFKLNEDFEVTETKEIWRDIIENFDDPFGTGFYFTVSNSEEELLFIKSMFGDASVGSLYEYDLTSNLLSILKDSTHNISSAVYWHGDDSRLIYYSYGNDEGLEAGYYLHDKTTDSDSLLLAYRSPAGPSEMLNGFDLHPDNDRLLIPLVQADRFTARAPLVGVYDLQTGQMDTLNVEFTSDFVKIGLWLRYSPDGSRILYCQFPWGSFTDTTNDWSEVGIIDPATGQKRILDVNTNPSGSRRSVQIAPTWSPDGEHIVYGSGRLAMPSGAKGRFSLYILKNVDDPRNFK